MEPITLLVLVAVAAVLALKSRAPQTTAIVPPTPTGIQPQPEPEPPKGPDWGKIVKDVGPAAGGAAAAGAGALGLKVTAAVLAKVFATIFGAAAAGFIGYELGGWLDGVLGGDKKGATAQILRFGIGGLAAGTVVGAVVFGLGTTLAFTGIGAIVVALTWIVATVIQDLERLHFGQNGAKGEMATEYATMFDTLLTSIRNLVNNAAAAVGAPKNLVPDSEIILFVGAAAHGYIVEWNRLRYETWMRRTWGLGVSRAYHAKFGYDRGYFVGPIDETTGDLAFNYDPQYFTRVADSDTTYKQAVEALPDALKTLHYMPVNRVRYVPKEITETKRELVETQAQNVSNKLQGVGAKGSKAAAAVYKTTIVRRMTTIEEHYVEQVPWWSDKRRPEFIEGGRVLANVAAYQKWMGEQWGIGQSAASHAASGRMEGRFEGEVKPDTGVLVWNHGLAGDKHFSLPTEFDFREFR